MTLTEFLLHRIAEDEAVARAAQAESPTPWENAGGSVYAVRFTIAGFAGEDTGPHIVRHDPARVLSECEAKRRIVELHRAWDDNDWQSPPYFSAPMDEVLSTLALPYADHDQFQEEWRV